MWVKVAAILLAVVCLFGGGYYAGHHVAALNAQVEISKINARVESDRLKAEQEARAKEQLAADTLAHIQDQNEQDRADAQAQYEKDVADLRAGNLRLRKQWQCPSTSVPGTTSGSGEPDAAADQRAADAANLVRIAADADAQIKALQQIVITDRSMK